MEITYDQEKQTATFCGPGTYEAKDEIKRLGVASWNGPLKSWKVRNLTLPIESLKELFPEAIIITSTLESNEVEVIAHEEEPTKSASGNVPDGISVSELISKIRLVLKNAFPTNVFVYGVLSSVKQTPDGRIFMEISGTDKSSDTAACVIWANSEQILKPLIEAGFKLEAELEVMFEARVDLNPRRAGISLSVVRIVAEYTISKLAAAREITNERLKKEELFDKNKKMTLPFLPKRLGLLTSAGGTVIHDFRAALDLANFDFELYWMDVSVQGAQAKNDIIRGLKRLIKIPGLDAILIFRGGGSPGDLAVFNDYEVAKEVCLCPLPVISAIGHQQDQSSVQDVSFLALGVPKDIGHYFANLINNLRTSYSDFTKVIHGKSTQLFELATQRITDFSHSLLGLSSKIITIHDERLSSWFSLKEARVLGLLERHTERIQRKLLQLNEQSELMVATLRDALQGLGKTLSANTIGTIDRQANRLRIANELQIVSNNQLDSLTLRTESLERVIREASPEVQLRRGFTLVRRAKTNDYLLSAKDLTPGDKVEIEFQDTTKEAEIIN